MWKHLAPLDCPYILAGISCSLLQQSESVNPSQQQMDNAIVGLALPILHRTAWLVSSQVWSSIVALGAMGLSTLTLGRVRLKGMNGLFFDASQCILSGT